MKQQINVSGTLIWYYYICQRQVWLISHQITPDQGNANITLGNFIHDFAYARERKELVVGSSKMDVFRVSDGELVVGEVKKSSKYRHSARMQLAFYLAELQDRGVAARGELRFPKERQTEAVLLDDHTRQELEQVKKDILHIVYLAQPPLPVRSNFCKKCAYAEFCWS